MILTGTEIANRVANGDIVIDPFLQANINPNSYNFRLAPEMKIYAEKVVDPARVNRVETVQIGHDGYVLKPRTLYLASTIEKLGSERFVPTYAARSSIARLGMFINLSAPLGDIGFIGNWTIQLYCLHPVRVYAGMNIGQMMFWVVMGRIKLYDGKYQGSTGAQESRIHIDFAKKLPALEAIAHE
jgi:dCTP deaminase